MAQRLVLVNESGHPLLSTPEDVARHTASIAPASTVAVDTEFHAEHRYAPRLLLVQVRTEAGDTLLIDPLRAGTLQAAAPALLRSRWIVHSGRQDLRLLASALGGLPEQVLDTQIAAGLREESYPSRYEALVSRHLQIESGPSTTLSNWAQRPLGTAQLEYAAADVRHLHALWNALWDTSNERRDMIAAACREAHRDALVDTPESWRTFEVASLLDPLEALILSDLLQWREASAREANQRPRSIANNGILVRIARTQPTQISDLSADRRFPKGLLKQRGDEVIAVVTRAMQKPVAERPATVRRWQSSGRLLAYLRCVVQALCAERAIASRLVCPTERLYDIAAAPPASRAALALQLGPWRDALIGNGIWAALRGECAIQWRDGDLRASPLA